MDKQEVKLQISRSYNDDFVRVSNDLSDVIGEYASVKILNDMFPESKVHKVQFMDTLSPNTILLSDENYTNLIDPCGLSFVDDAYLHSVDNVPSLTDVALGVTEELYAELGDIARDTPSTSVYEYISQRVSVVRAGDTFGSGAAEFLLCEPVDQGLVTEKTRFTVVKHTPTPCEYKFPQLQLSLSQPVGPVTLDLCPLAKRPTANDDGESSAYVKTGTLLKLLAVNGDSVMCGTKFLKVYALPEPNLLQPNTLYVSPTQYLNLGSEKTIAVKKATPRCSTASSVSVTRVGSAAAFKKSFQELCMAELTSYFVNSKKMYQKNDLIPITFDSVIAHPNLVTTGGLMPKGSPDTLVWFKVDEVVAETDSFYIDPNSTNLVIDGFTQMPVPQFNWKEYYGLPVDFVYDLDVFPYAKKLYNILHTTLTHELSTCVMLTSTTRKVGKSTLAKSIAAQCGVQLLPFNCFDIADISSMAKVMGSIRGKFDSIVEYVTPSVVLLEHVDVLFESESLKEGIATEIAKMIDDYVPGAIVILTCNNADKVPEVLRSKIKFEFEVPVPSEPQRKQIFEHLLAHIRTKNDVSITQLSLQSAGLTPCDLKSIVSTSFRNAMTRNTHHIDFSGGVVKLGIDDLTSAINQARNEFSDSIGAPKIPNVTWDDIGGLDMVKNEILDTIDMPLKHPELFASGVKKRSGILFYGPPGTGKTLLAKAIATNFSLNFFSVKGPELLNMYIGESEANVRRVFQKARDAKPCVVFFDELDSVAPKRGNQGDSGGVMDRIVSQLLAELDGMSSGDGDGVFVVGATNRPDLLDEALLRPGRFDKMLYLGISDTDEKQANILKALTRKFSMEDVDLDSIAKHCPFTYTGADFYALCSDSMLNAMTRIAGEVDAKIKAYNEQHDKSISTRYWFDNIATKSDIEVVVKAEDFIKARDNLVPSVSEEELAHYLRVRKNFEGQ